jgi:pimeloyl-ACP methyl ester carboxylesterase
MFFLPYRTEVRSPEQPGLKYEDVYFPARDCTPGSCRADAVAEISPIPLLIIQGDRDPIVPVGHARRLFELAREPKELWDVPGGGHIQAFGLQRYRDRFVAWLKQVLVVAPRVQIDTCRKGV